MPSEVDGHGQVSPSLLMRLRSRVAREDDCRGALLHDDGKLLRGEPINDVSGDVGRIPLRIYAAEGRHRTGPLLVPHDPVGRHVDGGQNAAVVCLWLLEAAAHDT
jgi:hypothetical protein